MLIQYCVIVSDNHAISDMMQMIPEMPIISENSSHFFQSKKEIHEKGNMWFSNLGTEI